MNNYLLQVLYLGFSIVMIIACKPKATYQYELSENVACLYPRSSWLPDYYTQFDTNRYSGKGIKNNCPIHYGTFKCILEDNNKCTMTYTSYGKQKEEVFRCKKNGDNYHCFMTGNYDYLYLMCKETKDSTGKLTCQKEKQFYSENHPEPSPEWFTYSDLAATIRHFTQQSIDNAGLSEKIKIREVNAQPGKKVSIIITGTDKNLLKNFASMHKSFLNDANAGKALAAIKSCQNTPDCWEPLIGDSPWSFYLPLGLAMINQKIVNYLNYPPGDALTSADYLNNFTMKRWNRVIASTGIKNHNLYDTIVDARPIAAPGSGQSEFMPDIKTFFNEYNVALIQLLSDPPTNNSRTYTLPVMVLGSDARKAWAEIIGKPFDKEAKLPYVGTNTIPGANKKTSWIATNHPDVTAYQCCPNDPASSCTGSSSYFPSYHLLEDEQIDLQAICTARALGESPEVLPKIALEKCKKLWGKQAPKENKFIICVNARLDYNYNATGKCKTLTDAEKFCKYYKNNPCPAGVFTCEIP